MPHRPSEFIIKKIKEFEGYSLKAYRCPAGVLTIGYGITSADKGITGTDITDNLEISEETAEDWLRKSLTNKYTPLVDQYDDKYHWNQNQFDALLCFSFNIGSINQLTNNGNRTIQEISNKIEEYNKANGKVLLGLVRRRKFERQLFDTPCEGDNILNDNIINNNIHNNKIGNENLKSIDIIVDEVIKGLWGNGDDRKNRLANAGYNFEEIQKEVDNKLKNKGILKSNNNKEEIARQVIRGKYGNGEERKKKLEAEGYNYQEIQNIVNNLLKNN